jgi:hypothetical protein
MFPAFDQVVSVPLVNALHSTERWKRRKLAPPVQIYAIREPGLKKKAFDAIPM